MQDGRVTWGPMLVMLTPLSSILCIPKTHFPWSFRLGMVPGLWSLLPFSLFELQVLQRGMISLLCPWISFPKGQSVSWMMTGA